MPCLGKRKDMQVQSFNFETKKINEAKRTIEFVGTTDDIDRYQEILTLDGWRMKDYKNNPVFLWAHEYFNPPIGKALRLRLKKDTGWLFLIEFAAREVYPFADLIFKLYAGGFLHAVSVGYLVKGIKYDKEKDQIYIIDKELLELSGCPVPGNQNALATDGMKMLSGLNIKSAVTSGCINDQEAGEFMKASKRYVDHIIKGLDPIIEYDTGFDLIGVDSAEPEEDTQPGPDDQTGKKDWEFGETDNPADKRKPAPAVDSAEPAAPEKAPQPAEDKSLTENIKKVNSIYSNLMSDEPVNDNGAVKDAEEAKSMADDLKAALK